MTILPFMYSLFFFLEWIITSEFWLGEGVGGVLFLCNSFIYVIHFHIIPHYNSPAELQNSFQCNKNIKQSVSFFFFFLEILVLEPTILPLQSGFVVSACCATVMLGHLFTITQEFLSPSEFSVVAPLSQISQLFFFLNYFLLLVGHISRSSLRKKLPEKGRLIFFLTRL